MRELTISARDFVSAGGQLSLAEWVDLSDEERAACVEARRGWLDEQASVIANRIIDRIQMETLLDAADVGT